MLEVLVHADLHCHRVLVDHADHFGVSHVVFLDNTSPVLHLVGVVVVVRALWVLHLSVLIIGFGMHSQVVRVSQQVVHPSTRAAIVLVTRSITAI